MLKISNYLSRSLHQNGAMAILVYGAVAAYISLILLKNSCLVRFLKRPA